ncbi:transcriptional regulator [Formosa agariphila KMM 3901]|uniref:Transcriptional regulator n=1 Tax=Formosa agariphila (strain DSM 15362 / KCTC 12365 / LMG 23005 / KMM 3901 / M-2Alg 35-1) TaxID=1347342 RepID=T2KI11_FORAG|nr:GyrI-like domain-containing protein [Formosa agariphila]CDF78435.1 transcriptional regulator [Formosa agariphila KMM 3901]
MKSTKYILFILLIAFIGSAIYVAVQPNDISFSKTKTFDAPQEVVYNYINNLNNWGTWVPWKKTSTSDSILNTKDYTWLHDNAIGRITTTEVSKPSQIHQKIVFPEYPVSQLNWEIDSVSAKTSTVTFGMASKNIPFKKKAYYAFFGTLEDELAPKFETSLNQLDSLISASMKVYSITINGITNHSGSYYLYKTTSCKLANLQDKIQAIKPELTEYVIENNIPMAGFPFVLYNKLDTENDAVIFSYCIPTTTQVITTEPDILTGLLPSFRTLKTTLKGDYDHLDKAWKKTFEHLETNGIEKSNENLMLETYVTNPKYKINPADWITEIYVAIGNETDSIPLDLRNLKLPLEDDNDTL